MRVDLHVSSAQALLQQQCTSRYVSLMLVRTSTRAGAEGENTDRHTNVLKERDLETLMPPELTERAYNLMAAQFVYYRFVTQY